MNDEIDILNGTDEFPYPQSINTTDFKTFDTSQIDLFLYKNHRFTSLEILIKDLKNLSQTLNQTLLNLVNNDYNDFINLGKSINGSNELMNYIIKDLKHFKSDLIKYEEKFDINLNQLRTILEKREELIRIKTNSKLIILLNDQIIQFDNCLIDKNDLKKLTGLYLSIIKISQLLNNDSILLQSLQNKVLSIKLEFSSYLKQNLQTNSNDFDLLNIYKFIEIN